MHRAILGLALSVWPLAADVNEDLLTAARQGNLEQVKALLDKGAQIETKTRHGITPLFFAARNGHAEVVTYLLSKGAKADVTDTFYGMSAVGSAMEKGDMAIIRALIQGGAKDPSLLSMALRSKDTELLKLILESGPQPAMQLNGALITAEQQGLSEAAALLKAKGAAVPKLEEALLQSYAGKYDMDGTAWTVVYKEGKLSATGPQTFPLTALDEKTFQVGTFSGVNFVFQNEGGKVTGFSFRQGARVMNAKRAE